VAAVGVVIVTRNADAWVAWLLTLGT
jgi:hypothetical protein